MTTPQLQLDATESVANALFDLLKQLEEVHPGIAERYGWVRIDDAAALVSALTAASGVKKPDGLQ